MQPKSNKNIILGLMLALCIAAGIWWWMGQDQTPRPPAANSMTQVKPDTLKPVEKPVSKILPQGVASVPALGPVVPTAGSLSRVTQLQAELNELKLEAQIMELKAKMRPSAPAPAMNLPDLPALTPPSSPPRMPDVPAVSSSKSSIAVVSVQGIGDNLSASIRAANGKVVTVRRGNRFGDGVVENISRQNVTLRNGKKLITLPFE